MHDLEQAAGDHEVLEEMDHHVLVGEIAMEEHGRDQAPERKRGGDRADSPADQQQQTQADLDGEGDGPAQGREREAGCPDHAGGGSVGKDFGKAAHNKNAADQDAPNGGQVARVVGHKNCLTPMDPTNVTGGRWIYGSGLGVGSS